LREDKGLRGGRSRPGYEPRLPDLVDAQITTFIHPHSSLDGSHRAVKGFVLTLMIGIVV